MGWRERFKGKVIASYLGERAVQCKRSTSLRPSTVECYFQADDPYSTLLVQVLPRILRVAGLHLEWRVIPQPGPQFDPEPDLRIAYATKDACRLAAQYGLEFPTDPQRPSIAAQAQAQRVLLVQRGQREQLATAREVGLGLWSGGSIARSFAEVPSAEAQLVRNQATQRRRGHYMGAMLRHRREWYWGLDRLHHLKSHLAADGVSVSGFAEPTLVPASKSGPAELTMFTSFRSPYAYIATMRAIRLCRAHRVSLKLRPVLPAVMRGIPVPLAKRLYIARDAAREARRYEVPFGNLCDPLGEGIQKCLAIFAFAEQHGLEAGWAESVGKGIWSEARNVAVDRDLRYLVERASIRWADAKEAIRSAPWQTLVERNQAALYDLGLWGVPSFQYGDYVAWGNDRLDGIERSLENDAT